MTTYVAHWTNGPIDEKIEVAERFEAYLRELFEQDADDEDLYCLMSVARDYRDDLVRIRDRKKLDEQDYYGVRNSNMLAAILLMELHEGHSQELAHWFYGIDEADHFLYLVANLLTDALQVFALSLESGRRKDFKPLTDDELAAITRILNGIPLGDDGETT